MVALNASLDLKAMLLSRLEADRLRVPPYPAIALKLQQIARDERRGPKDLTATITSDAALVAAILRRANSAANGAASLVTSLEGAVQRIGVEELLRIALAQSVGVSATSNGPLAALRRDAWRQALLGARMALELAPRRGVGTDEAFVACLLHDFGAIAVLVGLEDLKVELPVLPAETWKILVDRLHVQFGGEIAARWQLPAPIVDAVVHHHAAGEYSGAHRALVELVATVDHVVSIFERSATTSVAALLEVPGLSQEERYKLGAMVPQISEFIAAFDPQTPAAAAARAPSAVQPASVLDHGWSFAAPVSTTHETYESCTLTPNSIAFHARTALLPNWLAQITVGLDPPLQMLANVRSCTPDPVRGFLIVAQPFGLDGKDKQLWNALVQRARGSALSAR